MGGEEGRDFGVDALGHVSGEAEDFEAVQVAGTGEGDIDHFLKRAISRVMRG